MQHQPGTSTVQRTSGCVNCAHDDHYGERCEGLADGDWCACSWPDPSNHVEYVEPDPTPPRGIDRTSTTVAVLVDMNGPLAWHEVKGPYVEHAWLPIVGPTALLLARRLYETLGRGSVELDVAELAADIGVGKSRLLGAFARLERFGLARVEGRIVILRGVWPDAPANLARPRRRPVGATS